MSSKIIPCTLMDKYIHLITQGEKTVEARVAIPMFEKWRKGDLIRFFSRRNPGVQVIVKISRITSYKTFRKMLETEGVENLLPGISSVDDGEQIYLGIPNYSDREKQYGVLAFGLEVVSHDNKV